LGLDGALIGLRTRDFLLGVRNERCRIMPVVMALEHLVSEELLAKAIAAAAICSVSLAASRA